MRKLPVTSFFTARILFPASAILSFAIIFPMACSNNNTATGAPGSVSSAEGISGSGDDMYYEYTTTSTGKSLNVSGSTKLYVSAGGSVRSEMSMTNTALKKDKPAVFVVVANKDKPEQTISIDDDAKTYSVNIIDTAMSGGPFKTVSVVSRIGEEKIMGFNCVHARVISTKSLGPLGAQTDTIDLWNSPDVPLAPFFRYYLDKNQARSWTSLMSPQAGDQLKQMGCTGFMVKMQTGLKDAGVRMELTKVQKGDFPKAMFGIPSGYKQEQ